MYPFDDSWYQVVWKDQQEYVIRICMGVQSEDQFGYMPERALRNMIWRQQPPDEWLKMVYETCIVENRAQYGVHALRRFMFQMLDDYCPDWDYLPQSERRDFYLYLRTFM